MKIEIHDIPCDVLRGLSLINQYMRRWSITTDSPDIALAATWIDAQVLAGTPIDDVIHVIGTDRDTPVDVDDDDYQGADHE